MADKVRWLLVGAGDIARKRVGPALAQCPGSELVAACDSRIDQAAALAVALNVPEVYGDLTEALVQTAANAVYLATPVGLHVPQVLQALQAGKHVLVEKPLGLNGEECRRAVAAAAAQPAQLAGCAYYRRFFPRYLHAREMLSRGEFGKVVAVRMTYASWFSPEPDDPKYWRVIRAKSGGGPLSDMGTHMFDILIGLFGMPATIFAKCNNLVHAWDVEDSASLMLRLANGAHVTASFNWNTKTWRHEFEIVGTEARLLWLPYDSGPVVKTVGRDVQNLELPNAENVHLPLVEDFVQAIRDSRPPAVTLEMAAQTNTLLDAVYQSACENREILL
jgi:predicted dehydrogenase